VYDWGIRDDTKTRQRRAKVARLRAEGVPIRTIAAALGCAPSTVQLDIKALASDPHAGDVADPGSAEWWRGLLAREDQRDAQLRRILHDLR